MPVGTRSQNAEVTIQKSEYRLIVIVIGTLEIDLSPLLLLREIDLSPFCSPFFQRATILVHLATYHYNCS